MRVDELPIALLAFVAIVVMAPIWMHYLSGFGAARAEDAFLAAMVLPAVAVLFVASWISPELAGTMMGIFIVAGIVLMAPWFFRFVEMVSEVVAPNPLAQFVLQLAVPLLIVAYLVSLGRRRVAG